MTSNKQDAPKAKATNMGPLRGNNSFPASNKAGPNTSSRGGGGAAGDGRSIAAAQARRDDTSIPARGNGKGKKKG